MSGNANWVKGVSGNPGGRPKGSPNRQTNRIKQAYCDLIENNLENIQRWLTQTAQDNPGKALDLLIKLSPFVLPRKMEGEINIDNPFNIIIPQQPKEDE